MSIRKSTRGAFGSSRKSNKKLLGLEALENRQLLATDILLGVDGLEGPVGQPGAIGIGGTDPGDNRMTIENTEETDSFQVQWLDSDDTLVSLVYQGVGTVDIQLEGENPGETAEAPSANPGESTIVDDLLWKGAASINVSEFNANSSIFVFATDDSGAPGDGLADRGGLSNIRSVSFSTDGASAFGNLGLGNAWFSAKSGDTGVKGGGVTFQTAAVGDVSAEESATGFLQLGSVISGEVKVEGGGTLFNANGTKSLVSVNGFVPEAPDYAMDLPPGFSPLNGSGDLLPVSTGSAATISSNPNWDYAGNDNVDFAAFRSDLSDDSRVFLGDADPAAPGFEGPEIDASTTQADLDEWFAGATYLGEAYAYDSATGSGPLVETPLDVTVNGSPDDPVGGTPLTIGSFGDASAPQTTNVLGGLNFDLSGSPDPFSLDFKVGTVNDVLFDSGDLDDVRFHSNGTVGDFEVLGNVSETGVFVSSDEGAAPSSIGTMVGDLSVSGDASDFLFVADRATGDVSIDGLVSGKTGIEVDSPVGVGAVNPGPVTFGSTSGLVGATSGGSVYQINGLPGKADAFQGFKVTDGKLDIADGGFLALSHVDGSGVDLGFDELSGDFEVRLTASSLGEIDVTGNAGDIALLGTSGSAFGGAFVGGDAGDVLVDLEDSKATGPVEVGGEAEDLGVFALDSLLGDVLVDGPVDTAMVEVIGSEVGLVGAGGVLGKTQIVSVDSELDGFESVGDVGAIQADLQDSEVGAIQVDGDAGNSSVFMDESELGFFTVTGDTPTLDLTLVNESEAGIIDVEGNLGKGSLAVNPNSSVDLLAAGAVETSLDVAVIDGSLVDLVVDGNAQTVDLDVTDRGSIFGVEIGGKVDEFDASVSGKDSAIGAIDVNEAEDFFLVAEDQGTIAEGGKVSITGDVDFLDVSASGVKTEIGSIEVGGDARDVDLLAVDSGTIGGFAAAGETDNVSVEGDAATVGDISAAAVNFGLGIVGDDLTVGNVDVTGGVNNLLYDGADRTEIGDTTIGGPVTNGTIILDESGIGGFTSGTIINLLDVEAVDSETGDFLVNGDADTIRYDLDEVSTMGETVVDGDLELLDVDVMGSVVGAISVTGNVLDTADFDAGPFGLQESLLGGFSVGGKIDNLFIDLGDTRGLEAVMPPVPGMGDVTIGGESNNVDINLDNSILGDLSFGKDDASDTAVFDFDIDGAPPSFFGTDEQVGDMSFYGKVNYDPIEDDSNLSLNDLEVVGDILVTVGDLEVDDLEPGVVLGGIEVPDGSLVLNDTDVGLGGLGDILVDGDILFPDDFVMDPDAEGGSIESLNGDIDFQDLILGEGATLGDITAKNGDITVNEDIIVGKDGSIGVIEAGGDLTIIDDVILDGGTASIDGLVGAKVDIGGSVILSSSIGEITATGTDVIVGGDIDLLGDDSEIGSITAKDNVMVGGDVLLDGTKTSIGPVEATGGDVAIGGGIELAGESSGVLSVDAGGNFLVSGDVSLSGEGSSIGSTTSVKDTIVGGDIQLDGKDTKIGPIVSETGNIDVNGSILLNGESSKIESIEAGENVFVGTDILVDGNNSEIGSVLAENNDVSIGDSVFVGGTDAKIGSIEAGNDVLVFNSLTIDGTGGEVTKVFAGNDIGFGDQIFLQSTDAKIGEIHSLNGTEIVNDIILAGKSSSIGSILAGEPGATDFSDDLVVGGDLSLTGEGSSIGSVQALDEVSVGNDVVVNGGGSSIGEILSGDDPSLYPDWGTLFGEVPGGGIVIGNDLVIGTDGTDGNSVDLIAANDSAISVTGDVLVGSPGASDNSLGDVVVVDTFLDNNQGGFASNGALIDIVDNNKAVPFPSVINVADRLGEIEAVRVGIDGLTHDNSEDLEISLRSPDGTVVELMVDAGGSTPAADLDLNFVPEWLNLVPDSGELESTDYGPAAYGAVSLVPAGPADLNAFEGSTMVNGDWELFVADDSAGSTGEISDGWDLQIFTAGTSEGDVLFGGDVLLDGLKTSLGDVGSEDGAVVIFNDLAAMGTDISIGDLGGEDGLGVGGDVFLANTEAGSLFAGEYDETTGVVSPGASLANVEIAGDLILENSSVTDLTTAEGDIVVGGFLGLKNDSEIGEITLGTFDPDGSGAMAPVSTGGDLTIGGVTAMFDSKIGDITLVDGDAVFTGLFGMENSSVGDIVSGAYDQGASGLVTGGDIVFADGIEMLDSSIAASGGIGASEGDILVLDDLWMKNSEIGLFTVGINDPANDVSTGGSVVLDEPVEMIDSSIEAFVVNDGDVVWDDGVEMTRSEIGNVLISNKGSFNSLGMVDLEDSTIGDFVVEEGDVLFDSDVILDVSDPTDPLLASTIGDITIGTYDDPADIQTGGDLIFNGPVDLTNSTIAGTDGIFLEVGDVLFNDTVDLVGTDTDAPSSGSGVVPSLIGPVEVGRFDADDPFTSGGDVVFSGAVVTAENSAFVGFDLIEGNLVWDAPVDLTVSDTTNSDLAAGIGGISIGMTDGTTTTGGSLVFLDSLDLTNSTLSAADGIEVVDGNVEFVGPVSLTTDPLPGGLNPSVIGNITIGDAVDPATGGNLVVDTGITGTNKTAIGDLTLTDGDILLSGPISLGDDLGTGSAFGGDTDTKIGLIDVQDGFIGGSAGVADITAGRIAGLSVENSDPGQGVLLNAVIRAVDFQDNTVGDGGSFGDINLVQTNESGVGLTLGTAENPDPTKLSWEYGNQILSAGSIGSVNIESDGNILANDASLIIGAGVNSVNNGTGAGEQMRLPAGLTEIPSIGDIEITADFSGSTYGDNDGYGEGLAIWAGLYVEAETSFSPETGTPLPGVPSEWYYNTVNQAQIGNITINDIDGAPDLDIDRGTPVTVDGAQGGLSATIAVNALSGDDIGTLTVQHNGADFKTDLEPTVLEPFSHLTNNPPNTPILDDVLPTDMIVTLV